MPRGRPKGSVNKPKTELAPSQLKSLRNINRNIERLLDSYRSMVHPSYNDVVELDDNWMTFRYEFRKELTND